MTSPLRKDFLKSSKKNGNRLSMMVGGSGGIDGLAPKRREKIRFEVIPVKVTKLSNEYNQSLIYLTWKCGKESGKTENYLVSENMVEFRDLKITFYVSLFFLGNNEYEAKKLSLSFREESLKGKNKNKLVGKVDINLGTVVNETNEYDDKSYFLKKDQKEPKLKLKLRPILIKLNNRKILSEINEDEAKKVDSSKLLQRGLKYYITQTDDTNLSNGTLDPISELDFNEPIEEDDEGVIKYKTETNKFEELLQSIRDREKTLDDLRANLKSVQVSIEQYKGKIRSTTKDLSDKDKIITSMTVDEEIVKKTRKS